MPPDTVSPEGNALVYCEGSFGTTYGKTAHGLVRRSGRYRVLAILDSQSAGRDAGEMLDGRPSGVPVMAGLAEALAAEWPADRRPTHFVVGLAPDGGRLPAAARATVVEAIGAGLSVVSGLHDLLSEDPEMAPLAAAKGVTIHDVRKPPPRSELHFFSGKIGEVDAFKIAVLGTDSAVGKRTTAWLLVDALGAAGFPAELVGTGQTAWMQGARYSIPVDALVSDFIAGEIEHAVWSAWSERRPRAIVIEGQGSLMNPGYPGGYEILAAGRPDAVVLQHAPARREYDGFPGYPIHPLALQRQAIELVSGRPVVAVTINHEGLDADGVERARAEIADSTGLPAFDVLTEGAAGLVEALRPRLEAK